MILRDISIEEIDNGTVISYRFAETYETKKKYFPTPVEARTWLCGEIQKEIEYHAPKELVHVEKAADYNEIPF